jgi:hypothetical protein
MHATATTQQTKNAVTRRAISRKLSIANTLLKLIEDYIVRDYLTEC